MGLLKKESILRSLGVAGQLAVSGRRVVGWARV